MSSSISLESLREDGGGGCHALSSEGLLEDGGRSKAAHSHFGGYAKVCIIKGISAVAAARQVLEWLSQASQGLSTYQGLSHHLLVALREMAAVTHTPLVGGGCSKSRELGLGSASDLCEESQQLQLRAAVLKRC
jgi:hypothetical protein